MPTISFFYGIVFQMYWDDHNPPNFYARYGRAKAMVRIADGEVVSGELPPTAARMVREWTLLRRAELEENWQRAINLRPLYKIAGPDSE